MVGLEQAVEPEQRCEQGGNPQYRRGDARKKCQIGPDRKGCERHEDQKKDDAEAGAAADTTADPQFSTKKR